MKSRYLAFILCTLFIVSVTGQSFNDALEEIGPDTDLSEEDDGGLWSMGGGLGLLLEEDPVTGETTVYAQMGIQPELALGQFGLGLDLTLNYDLKEGEFKEADYDEDEDYLKLIRYVRYGKSPTKDGVYLKAGGLDNATIGHGIIINRYRTDVDYDNRRAGLQCNVNYDYVGIETFTNNLFLGEVIGGRVVVRPLAGRTMPIIKGIGFGFSYAFDSSAPYKFEDNKTYDYDNEEWIAGFDDKPDWDDEGNFLVDEKEKVAITGFDAELPVLRGDILGLNLYADYARMTADLDDYSSSDGFALGLMFKFDLTSGNNLYLKVEERFIDRSFLPAYFDKMYEIERYQFDTEFPMQTKLLYVESLPDSGRYKGIYGEVAVELLSSLEVWGTFEDNMDVSNDGEVELGAGFKEIAGIKCAAEYHRSNIDDNDINDIFTLDDRSVFLAYLAYKLNAFMNVGAVFRRDWELNEETGEYEPVDTYNVGVSFNTEF